jgi:hypothetical protein
MSWHESIDTDAICWHDYLAWINRLPVATFPACDQLNSVVPEDLRTASGARVQFICSSTHAEGSYEDRIYTSGQISTRRDSWHDLFNALVWLRFPKIKAAINNLHFQAQSTPHGRGRLRDALTLFDECGVLVISSNEELLSAIGKRDWHSIFQVHTQAWGSEITLATFGHAMLEKYLTPYKSMTANALLVKIPAKAASMPRDQLLGVLDLEIARKILEKGILNSPTRLTPLPLAGVPDWIFPTPQTNEFYTDMNVFRPAPGQFNVAPNLLVKLDIS